MKAFGAVLAASWALQVLLEVPDVPVPVQGEAAPPDPLRFHPELPLSCSPCSRISLTPLYLIFSEFGTSPSQAW